MRDVVFAAFCLAACSGGSSFNLISAASGNQGFGGDRGGVILLSDAPSTCARYGARVQVKNSHTLTLLVMDATTAPPPSGTRLTPPAAPGVYATMAADAGSPPAHWAEGSLLTLDGTCLSATHDQLRGAGSVTLTQASGGSYAGSFDMSFEGGEHLTGSFQAPDCLAIDANLDAGVSSCQ